MSQEKTNIISGSGNRENPRVELEVNCFINKIKHKTKNISSGGLSCEKNNSDNLQDGQVIDINISFDVDGFYVFFKDKGTIINQTDKLLMIEFSGENKKGKKLLEYIIDGYLTGDMEKNKKMISGILGMNQKDEQVGKDKKSAISLIVSSILLIIAFFIIYKNISTVNVEYSTVSKEVYVLESPTNGKVYPKIKEGQEIEKDGLAFIIKDDDDGATLLSLTSKRDVNEKELELKERELEDAELVLSTHLSSLKKEGKHLNIQIERIKNESYNRFQTYKAYKKSFTQGYTSKTKYLEEHNQYLKLRTMIEEKRALKVKMEADILNAENGLYSKNAIFEESFISPKKIKREIELLKSQIISQNKNIIGLGDGITELFSNRKGIIEKLLAEYGNGIVNGQDLALISHEKAKKYIVSVIESKKVKNVSKNKIAKVYIGEEVFEGKIIDIKHSYTQVDFATNGNKFYGIDELKKPENSFVFIEVDQEILKNISIGSPIEVEIASGYWIE